MALPKTKPWSIFMGFLTDLAPIHLLALFSFDPPPPLCDAVADPTTFQCCSPRTKVQNSLSYALFRPASNRHAFPCKNMSPSKIILNCSVHPSFFHFYLLISHYCFVKNHSLPQGVSLFNLNERISLELEFSLRMFP